MRYMTDDEPCLQQRQKFIREEYEHIGVAQLSFEFFPPKTEQGEQLLLAVAERLALYQPEFFSVTYGAGGSTQMKTPQTVALLLSDPGMCAGYTIVPHLSCIGAQKAEMIEMLRAYQQLGVKRIVALRGDHPSGTGRGAGGDFNYASEFVAFIREQTEEHFDIDVAVYPECHPESNGMKDELRYFQNKIAAGANRAITQYFFNPDAYFYFLDACAASGINVPIVPGIMPIQNFASLMRFSNTCGAEIPKWLQKRLESYRDDFPSLRQFGIEVVTRLCENLLKNGAPGLHFYTLNQLEPTLSILKANEVRLGASVRPRIRSYEIHN